MRDLDGKLSLILVRLVHRPKLTAGTATHQSQPAACFQFLEILPDTWIILEPHDLWKLGAITCHSTPSGLTNLIGSRTSCGTESLPNSSGGVGGEVFADAEDGFGGIGGADGDGDLGGGLADAGVGAEAGEDFVLSGDYFGRSLLSGLNTWLAVCVNVN